VQDGVGGRKGEARTPYLESLRGLAAMQVLFLHAFSAYAPALVFDYAPPSALGFLRDTPLAFIADGGAAVSLFFVLSGFVLTPSFARSVERPGAVAVSRYVRLAVPAIAAAAVALLVKVAVGTAPAATVATEGWNWLTLAWRPPLRPDYDLIDALAQGPLIGYRESSLLAFLGLKLTPVNYASLGPLWTLSIEMQGSLLVLALVICRRRGERLWQAALVAALALFGRTYLLGFVVGHVLAETNAQAALRRWPASALAALALGGLLVCWADAYVPVGALACEAHAWRYPCNSHWLKIAGAILVFVAALGSERAERALTARPLLWLGKLSFPIYLVHWPVVCGVSTLFYLAAAGGADSGFARFVAVVASVGLSLLAASAFHPIDAVAIEAARQIRKGSGRSAPQPALRAA